MSSTDQTIVLITGANGGIGFSLATQLLENAKYLILLGSRSAEKGAAAVKQLQEKSLPGKVELVQIDVSDEDSIQKAKDVVEEKYGRIDALVNNAAITGEEPASSSLATRMTSAFLTNATGPAIIVETFAPLLAKSAEMGKTPRILNVSSGAGSIGLRSDRTNPHQAMKNVWPPLFQSAVLLPYRSSKAALNMLTACQDYEYGPKGWKVFCFCPGFTESNLGPRNKPEHGAKPTSEGAKPMVAILEGERDDECGGFLKAEGGWPW